MRLFLLRLFVLLIAGLGLGACGGDAPRSPAAADTMYGAAVDAAEAVPAPAVAAEADRYVGRRLTVDGRVVATTNDGCGLRLDTGGGGPLHVDAPRHDGACAWKVPPNLDGIAVAAGTLRLSGDTLRLAANGVQVTPVRLSESDP